MDDMSFDGYMDFEEYNMNAIIDVISDGWYNLLAVYDEMDILIENHSERSIMKNDFIKSKDYKEKIYGSEHDMKIIYNDSEVGTLRVKARMDGFKIAEFKDFVVQASQIRKELNSSMLIPPGLLLKCKNEFIWENPIAKEIIFRTDLEKNHMEYINNESLIEKDFVSVNNFEINGFEIMVIKIPVISEKKIIGDFIIMADNTLNKRNEKELNNKTAVIKEIHHRVKNNLQTISSLLRLQMRRVNNKIVEKAFTESINRINSIALIHEELSKVGIEKVNIKSAIASIMETILTTMTPPEKDIKGKIEGLDIYVGANKASSLSLCVTELIQNSVEHAFIFRKKGIITVRIEECEDYITIVVEDDGVGFARKKSKTSLGIEIIEMITNETLRGTFNINGHLYGTQSEIRFPIK